MMETDYLLQRVEGYSSAVILATNLRQQIDEAFLRRIHVVTEFPFPDKDQRAELCLRSLQRRLSGQTRQQIMYEFSVQLLAEKYSLSGAAVDSIVEDAEIRILRPQRQKARLNEEDILAALSTELHKMGRPSLG